MFESVAAWPSEWPCMHSVALHGKDIYDVENGGVGRTSVSASRGDFEKSSMELCTIKSTASITGSAW
jgi:hypothetical protein